MGLPVSWDRRFAMSSPCTRDSAQRFLHVLWIPTAIVWGRHCSHCAEEITEDQRDEITHHTAGLTEFKYWLLLPPEAKGLTSTAYQPPQHLSRGEDRKLVPPLLSPKSPLCWWQRGLLGQESSFLLKLKTSKLGTSLAVQWLRIRLPMQATRVQAPVREDPTCRGATKPVHHNCWARVPQLLKPTRHNYWSLHA